MTTSVFGSEEATRARIFEVPTCVKAGLSRFPEAEREETVQETRDHAADATAAGRDVSEVLAALGPADALARAYVMEQKLHRRGRRSARWIARSP